VSPLSRNVPTVGGWSWPNLLMLLKLKEGLTSLETFGCHFIQKSRNTLLAISHFAQH